MISLLNPEDLIACWNRRHLKLQHSRKSMFDYMGSAIQGSERKRGTIGVRPTNNK